MANTPLQNTLTEIVKNLEIVAANVGAMEMALVERGLLTFEQTDSHRPNSLQSVKSALANARYLISRLPD
jgi:hypothetical protein